MSACSLLFRYCFLLLVASLLLPAVTADTTPLWTVQAPAGDEFSTVVMSGDGSIVVGGGDRLVAVTGTGEKLWSGWSGSELCISRDGRYLVTSQGNTVRLFSRDGIMLWDQSIGTTVTAIDITPDAAIVAAGGGSYVQSWYNSGVGLGMNKTETVQDLKISPAKDQIVVGTTKALRGFNLSYVPFWDDEDVAPSAVAISGDGSSIVVPNGIHLRMYHGSGTLLWDRTFSGGSILALAYSTDGSTIVAGRDDGSVIAVDRAGNLLWKATAGQWVTSVAVSDNGSVIATGSIDRQVRVFSRAGVLLGSGTTQNAITSRSVAVSGDGALIVAADSARIYAFAPAQFAANATVSQTTATVPETPVTVTTAAVRNTTNPTTARTASDAGLVFTATTAPASVGTSIPTDLPWILVPVAFFLIVLAGKRKTR